MAVRPDAVYEKEYNCLVTDLDTNGKPPITYNGALIEDGSKMYVWNVDTDDLADIYKMVFGGWKKF